MSNLEIKKKERLEAEIASLAREFVALGLEQGRIKPGEGADWDRMFQADPAAAARKLARIPSEHELEDRLEDERSERSYVSEFQTIFGEKPPSRAGA